MIDSAFNDVRERGDFGEDLEAMFDRVEPPYCSLPERLSAAQCGKARLTFQPALEKVDG